MTGRLGLGNITILRTLNNEMQKLLSLKTLVQEVRKGVRMKKQKVEPKKNTSKRKSPNVKKLACVDLLCGCGGMEYAVSTSVHANEVWGAALKMV